MFFVGNVAVREWDGGHDSNDIYLLPVRLFTTLLLSGFPFTGKVWESRDVSLKI